MLAKILRSRQRLLLVAGMLLASRTTIVVADREISGIKVEAYAELVGKAVLQDGSRLPDFSPALMLQAQRKGFVGGTAIRNDGTFRFPLLEGEYRIAVGKLPAGLSVKSISYGSIDLLRDPLKLDGSSAVQELRITLEKTP